MVLANFMRQIRKDGFDVVLGTEAMLLPAVTMGVQAFIPGLGNAFPDIFCAELFDAAHALDIPRARSLQRRVNQLRDIMYLAKSTVVAVYALLKIRGICEAYPREPFIPLGEAESAAMRARLVEIGAIS